MPTATLNPTRRRTAFDLASRFGYSRRESLIDRCECYAEELRERIDAEPNDDKAFDLHVRYDAWCAWRQRVIKFGLKAGVLEERTDGAGMTHVCTMRLSYETYGDDLTLWHESIDGALHTFLSLGPLHAAVVPECLQEPLEGLKDIYPYDASLGF